MKQLIIVSALAMLFPSLLLADVVQMQPREIITGAFGDAPHEYAHSRIVDEAALAAVTVVSCFTVTEEYILVFDLEKRDIKVYTLVGEYVKTIETGIKGQDIALLDGEIVLLVDFNVRPTDPNIKWSRFQVFTFDLETGEEKERYFVHNPIIGTFLDNSNNERHRIGGAVLLVASKTSVFLYDHRQQKSYPLILGKRVVDPDVQMTATIGCCGQTRIRQNPKTGIIEMLQNDGSYVRDLRGTGTLTHVTGDGDRYVMITTDANKHLHATVYTIDGGAFADAKSAACPNWWSFNPWDAWHNYKLRGDRMYELYVDADGVHLIEWR